MAVQSPFLQNGRGMVPATRLTSAAWKELCELPATSMADVIAPGIGAQLDFTSAGLSLEQFRAFFDEAMAAAKKVEPICEAGNKYSVDSQFAKLNGELLLHEIKTSAAFESLPPTDRERASKFFEIMCLNGNLRNRNPLHPNPLDSAVIANLLNFPKHIFGFPFACYSTNGNESLSIVLFAYRAQCFARQMSADQARVVYVMAEGEAETALPPDIEACAARLSMPFEARYASSSHDLSDLDAGNTSVILCDLGNPQLGRVAKWAARAKVAVHVHVLDHQVRSVLARPSAVHFALPEAVRSMSIENGFFRSGFQLYRDPELRDLHFDLPYHWQSQYLSPNEGGSGNTTPLYIDFCFILLGWDALRAAAGQTAVSKPSEANLENAGRLQPLLLAPMSGNSGSGSSGSTDSGGKSSGTSGDVTTTALEACVPRTLEGVTAWALENLTQPRHVLEAHVLQFQRHFAGGKDRSVEAITSGGGTRSINYAFESVLARAKMAGVHPVKCVTGTPHLAVERAERRFLFEVVRVHSNGAICLDGLKEHVRDPCVLAVYAQTLSITDGITDPLAAVLGIIEEENQRRKRTAEAKAGTPYAPITLINDSCLAFSVLLHNDGERYGPECLRVLDLTRGCITPTIMTQDAHKHLGADKGISMAMGTPGTLSLLEGHVKVGAQPTRGELVRAMADMLLVGYEGYHEKYNRLAAAVDAATQKIEAAGMRIIHAQNRARGSTAFSVEDPSARVTRMLKGRGHGPSPVFRMHPNAPERCQTGFLMSLTPHALREIKPGVSALDIFVADLTECHTHAVAKPSRLAQLFREDSLPGILLSSGNEDVWVFAQLRNPGVTRDVLSVVLRRLYSAIFDSGVVCTHRQHAPLASLLTRSAGMAAFVAAGGYGIRRARL